MQGKDEEEMGRTQECGGEDGGEARVVTEVEQRLIEKGRKA